MPRTTRAQIATIVELDEDIAPDDISMQAFIIPANELVTEGSTGASGPGTPYTEDRLELIERWLAAHFYTNRVPLVTHETAGGMGETKAVETGIGFENSIFGQTAMRLDTNGGLARLNHNSKKGAARAGATWLGTKKKA